jgi:hypothetical protein
MKIRIAALACLAASILVREAYAAPNRLDVLRTAVESRPEDGLTKAQLKTLAKADKLLGKTPANTSSEVATAISVVKLLDKAFPGDAQFAFVLDNAIPEIQVDVTADHDALATLLAALPEGKKRTKAQSAMTAAEASVGGVAAAPDRPTRLGLLKSAVASIGKGFNAVAARQSYMIATLDDGGGPRRIVVTRLLFAAGLDAAADAYQVHVGGFAARRQLLELILYPVPAAGPIPLGAPPRDLFAGSAGGWTPYPRAFLTTDVAPGVATITRFDGRRAFDATFSFTATHEPSGATVTVTDGVLRVR